MYSHFLVPLGIAVVMERPGYGELLLGVYGLYVIARGRSQAMPFKLALAGLAITAALNELGDGDTLYAEMFAVYVFYLLCIGVIDMILDLSSDETTQSLRSKVRDRYNKRRRNRELHVKPVLTATPKAPETQQATPKKLRRVQL